MGILSGKQREILAEFHDQLFDDTKELYVRDFFPPDGDDGGVPIHAPDPPPSMPELKSFDEDKELPSDDAWEFAGHVGELAFAAMARSEQTV